MHQRRVLQLHAPEAHLQRSLVSSPAPSPHPSLSLLLACVVHVPVTAATCTHARTTTASSPAVAHAAHTTGLSLFLTPSLPPVYFSVIFPSFLPSLLSLLPFLPLLPFPFLLYTVQHNNVPTISCRSRSRSPRRRH